MGRGGFRPSAGRPKGSKNRKVEMPAVKTAVKRSRLTPLEYMLAVLNDDDADPGRRDRMAVAAAPHVHRRVGDARKKEAAAEAARAETGAPWDELLQ